MNTKSRLPIPRKRVFITAFSVILLGLLSFLGGCVSFYPPLSDGEIAAKFPVGQTPRSHTILADERPFHYVDVGDEEKPLVVFVHGAPGAWDAFADFLQDPRLLERARLISVDRPGYGRSSLGRPERSLSAQAAILSTVFRHNPAGRRAILVGHSYGGPVIARMAIDYPESVAGLVFVAASVDPTLEETKWYQIPAHWKLLSWAVPDDLYTTNEEILPLKDELEVLEAEWTALQVPSIVIQGERDQLVPKENADYLERVLAHLEPSIRRHPELNHFIPWSAPELIVEAVLELLDENAESAEGNLGDAEQQ